MISSALLSQSLQQLYLLWEALCKDKVHYNRKPSLIEFELPYKEDNIGAVV